MKDTTVEDFITYLREMIGYWDSTDSRDSKVKLEGLAFSILCALDGVSGSFRGSIENLEKASRGIMMHDQFYKGKS